MAYFATEFDSSDIEAIQGLNVDCTKSVKGGSYTQDEYEQAMQELYSSETFGG